MIHIWPLEVWSPVAYEMYLKRKAEEILGPEGIELLEKIVDDTAYFSDDIMDQLEVLGNRKDYVWSYTNGKGVRIKLRRVGMGDIRDNNFSTPGMRENYGSLCGDKADNEVPRHLQAGTRPKPEFRKHLQKVVELRGLMTYARVNNINWVDFVEDAYLLEDELSS